MMTIKRLMIGLLKSRRTRWSMLAVVSVAAGLSLAWNTPHYQLGGGIIGGSPGFTWNTTIAPLDPAGRTGADRVGITGWGADFQVLLAGFGADTVSDLVGESRMISRDTARFTHIGYAQSAAAPGQIKAILVASGTFKFLSQSTAMVTYTVSIYPPTPDGVPNLSADPLYTTPVATDPAMRVSLL